MKYNDEDVKKGIEIVNSYFNINNNWPNRSYIAQQLGGKRHEMTQSILQ